MATNLSEEELREAAAEAGISPQELRIALAERNGNLPDRPSDAGSALGPPTRGVSATHVEGRLGSAPKDALAAVRSAVERQTGKSGHNQGDAEADVVDDDNGITYRVRTTEDGAGGSLVRIDVDPSAGKGTSALAVSGTVGVATAVVLLAWLVSSTLLWIGGLGLGVLGGYLLVRSLAGLKRGTASAHAIAAHALMEAEDQAGRSAASPKALPPH